MHDYANLCIIMHASEIILFSSLQTIMTKTCANVQPVPVRRFWKSFEKCKNDIDYTQFSHNYAFERYHFALVGAIYCPKGYGKVLEERVEGFLKNGE